MKKIGTWSQRRAMPNCAGVCARIIQTSIPAVTAVASASWENRRLAQAERLFHHTSTCTAASVRHADASIDQITVIQLIGPSR